MGPRSFPRSGAQYISFGHRRGNACCERKSDTRSLRSTRCTVALSWPGTIIWPHQYRASCAGRDTTNSKPRNHVSGTLRMTGSFLGFDCVPPLASCRISPRLTTRVFGMGLTSTHSPGQHNRSQSLKSHSECVAEGLLPAEVCTCNPPTSSWWHHMLCQRRDCRSECVGR